MMDAKKVDVIAIFDSHAEGVEQAYKVARGKNRYDTMLCLMEFREARDAMAELIAAVPMAILELRAYRDDCEYCESPELVDRLEETTERLAKAYARIGAPA